MTRLWFHTALGLADVSHRKALLDALGSKLRGGPDMVSMVLLFIGVVFLIAVIYIAVRRFGLEGSGHAERPRDLFADAFGILSLDTGEQSDLRYVAERSRMREPLAMLLSPRVFALAVDEVLRASPDPERYRRLATICRKLFDSRMPNVTEYVAD